MKTYIRTLAVLLLVVVAATASAQEVLTNDAVVAMKKAGLSESIILAKIRGSKAKFDTSTQALVGLKQAGLSDAVIEAMVSHAGPSGGAAGTPAAAVKPGAADGLPQIRDAIFHVKGAQYVEMTPAIASVETNFQVFSSKSELVLRGRKAPYRVVDERQPVFFSAWAPNEVPLVKLKPGDKHDDRNLKFSSGAFMPYGGTQKTGVRQDDVIDVESERDPRGFYRLKPREPLKPGEYGFILTSGFGGGGGKIFDFGVD